MFYFVVNGTPLKVTTTGKEAFQTVEQKITLTEEANDLTFGIYPTSDGEYYPENEPAAMGSWFKADDFALTLITANQSIELTFEYDVNTLILPFNHEIPEGLRVFEAPGIYESSRDGVEYQLVVMQPVQTIEAHKPYLVRTAVETPSNAPKHRIQFNESGNVASTETFTFSGIPTGDLNTSYEHGVLTGVHQDTEIEAGHYVLNQDAESVFNRIAQGNTYTVPAHRAYIGQHVANLDQLRFSEKGVPTGVENVSWDASNDDTADVYTLSGVKVATQMKVSELRSILPAGIYLVRTPNSTIKLAL